MAASLGTILNRSTVRRTRDSNLYSIHDVIQFVGKQQTPHYVFGLIRQKISFPKITHKFPGGRPPTPVATLDDVARIIPHITGKSARAFVKRNAHLFEMPPAHEEEGEELDETKSDTSTHEEIQVVSESSNAPAANVLDHFRSKTTTQQGSSSGTSEIGHTVLTLGNMTVQVREDGYVNATKLCQDGGKEWKHYNALNSTQTFFDVLSTSVGSTTSLLVSTNCTGPNETRGTFVHPDIAIHLAQWISPELGQAVLDHFRPKTTIQQGSSRTGHMVLTLGNMTVQFREDGYVNATKLCRDSGKMWGTYAQNARSKALVLNVSKSIGIPIDLLVSTNCTGPNETRGTFVHPDIAIHLAQWIDPELGQAVLDHFRPKTTIQQGSSGGTSGTDHKVLTLGNMNVQFREDGYVNATKLCKDGGKEWSHYKENVSSRDFSVALSLSLGIARDLLTSSNCTGPNETRGTFVHPDIAIHLAQWISPELGQAVLDHLRPNTTIQQGASRTSEIGHMVLTLGNMNVQFRDDGYVNATKLCKNGGKEWGHYIRNSTTDAFVKALSSSSHIRRELLITYQHAGPYETRGTFVHPDIAIHLAQWISAEFAVGVSQLVRRYVSGQVTTEESQQVAEEIAASCEPVAMDTDDAETDPVIMDTNEAKVDVIYPSLTIRPVIGNRLVNMTQPHYYTGIPGANCGITQAALADPHSPFAVIKAGVCMGTNDRSGQHNRTYDGFQVLDRLPYPPHSMTETMVKRYLREKGLAVPAQVDGKTSKETETFIVSSQEEYACIMYEIQELVKHYEEMQETEAVKIENAKTKRALARANEAQARANEAQARADEAQARVNEAKAQTTLKKYELAGLHCPEILRDLLLANS